MSEIKYPFVASGQQSIIDAFRSIERAAHQSAAAAKKANDVFRASPFLGGRAPRGAGAGAGEGPSAPARARVTEQEKALRHVAGIRDRYFRDEQRAQERTDAKRRALIRSQIRDAEQSGKAQAQADARFRRQREQADASELRRHQQRVSQARRQGGASGRSAGMASARLASSAEGASYGGIIKEAFSGTSIRSAIGSLGSVMKGVAMGAVGSAVALGVGVTGAATKDAMRTQEIANRVSINSRMAGKNAVDPTVLRKEFEATAAATPGQTAANIGNAVQAFVTKTGDLSTARKNAGTFATVASATGGDVVDIANAAADISQKFDIKGLEEMREALAALTFQGKEGAFELASAAEKFARMGSAASAFGFNKGVGGLKTLGGLSQIIQSSTGNADVTSTALSAMLRQFVGQSGKIKRLTGVNVFKDAGKTQTRDIQDLIVETIAGAKGNQAKIQDIFGDEGGQAIKPMLATFNQAGAALGANSTEEQRVAAGRTAVRAQLDKAINAPGTFADLEEDASQSQQDVTARLTNAWEKIVAVAGDKLLPVITELAESIADTPELLDAFREALELLVGMLRRLGVLNDPKERSLEKVRDDARQEAIATHKKLSRMIDSDAPRTQEDIAQQAMLQAKYDAAAKQAQNADALVKAKQSIATPDQLADQLISTGAKAATPEEERKRQDAMRTYAAQVFDSPVSFSNAERRNVGGQYLETDEQLALRQDVARSQQAKNAGLKDEASGVGGSLSELVAAFKKAAGEIGSTTTTAKPATITS